MVLTAALFLLLSGVSSLTYQVVWVRLLGLSLGSTSASISTVLAAFFLGLALGSYLAEKLTRNHRDDLRVYIALELLIGCCGLVLLPVLLQLPYWMAALPVLGAVLWFKFLVTVLLLLLPTICMGATFPVMAALLIRRHGEIGLRTGQLYSLNTMGAVMGAVFAGFVFIPNWGLDGAVYIAAAINFLIVLLALALNKPLRLPPVQTAAAVALPEQYSSEDSGSIAHGSALRTPALLVLFSTGLVAIATEVGWTKYLSIFTGTTIYGFAAILAVFLTGIAIGSWLIRRHLDHLPQPALWMAVGLLALGLSLLVARALLSFLPPVFEALNHFPVATWLVHATKYFIVLCMLIIPTVLLGALFPLNIKLYCGTLSAVRARIGKAYAVNTLAGIVGALSAGFWIIPQYGTDTLLSVTALLVLTLPLLFVRHIQGNGARAAVVSLCLSVSYANWLIPHIRYEELIASVQYQYDVQARNGDRPEVLFVKEGKTGVISLASYDGEKVNLQNNGLNESFFNKAHLEQGPLPEYFLGLVPYFLHPHPKSAFVVGFGGGFTTQALTLTEGLERIDVVELEPAIIEANRFIGGGSIPALEDKRMHLSFNDARNSLLLKQERYDIIAAQPSHPWLARASTVFTEEFFQLVHSRLNDDGIYAQWLNLFNMDVTTLRAILKAFYQVFPYGMTLTHAYSGDYLLFGAKQPVRFDPGQIEPRMAETKIQQALAPHEIYNTQDILWYFSLSRDQALALAGDSVTNNDTNILSEVRLSALDATGTDEENPYVTLEKHATLDVRSYLSGDKAEQLLQLAKYFINWNKDDLAMKTAVQLQSVAPPAALAVEYERLRRMADYEAAFALYDACQNWPQDIHYQQGLALLESGDYKAAQAVLQRMQTGTLKRQLHMRLLYAQHRFKELVALEPEEVSEQEWQALGIAQQDVLRAGKMLEQIADQTTLDLPQLRLLITYYGQVNDPRHMTEYSRRMLSVIDERLKNLKILAENALEAGSVSRLQRILTQMDKLDADYKESEALRESLRNLQSQVAQNS